MTPSPKMIFNQGILSTIGDTPLVELSNLFKKTPFNVFAKLEFLNPGGSLKDRPAMNILKNAFESGEITSDSVIIESSSGNMGIGMAKICRVLGLRFICVVDIRTTRQNLRIMRALGAEVEIVREPDPATGDLLQARLNRVHKLLDRIENSYWPNQYENLCNPESHKVTMQEILNQLDEPPDYIFCAASTCGTLRGFAEFIRANELVTKMIAVDAVGSMIFGDKRAKRLIPGMGAGIKPPFLQDGLADHVIHVTDLDCITGCRRLALKEGFLIGGSSGGIVSAVKVAKDFIRPDATCVLMIADRGDRYLDTVFSDRWVEEHFGNVFHHWSTNGKIKTQTKREMSYV